MRGRDYERSYGRETMRGAMGGEELWEGRDYVRGRDYERSYVRGRSYVEEENAYKSQ